MFAIHQLLSRAAQAAPDHDAVCFADRSLSYGDLDVASNGVAQVLMDAGVRRGDRVAIYLPKTEKAIVAAYGILKAGAVYVPIDPKAPPLRAASIADDCSIRGLVATPRLAADLLAGSKANPIVLLSVEGGEEPIDVPISTTTYAEATADREASNPQVPVVDADLAYILYTSGSTGFPKGVMLSHRHALTFIEWCASTIGTGTADRFSSHAPLHFDLSVFDLYVAAYGGATVCVIPEEHAFFGAALARFIREEHISVWYSVPSALMMLTRALSEPGTLRSLRSVVFAGEVYPTRDLRALRRLVPDAALWNLYGPTETNVCTYHRVDQVPDDDTPIPIGRPCENTEVFAVREDGRAAGVGEEGELHVRGSTVMVGYWGGPELSANVLVPNPVTPHLPERVYRTGDLVRLRPDGGYDFIGRSDHQIKTRGYRVELGEVEVALQAINGLREAVAVAVPHNEWGNEIVAYAVPMTGAQIDEASVKHHVAERLPRYMIPARVEIVPMLPRTSTGKIDRQQLRGKAAS